MLKKKLALAVVVLVALSFAATTLHAATWFVCSVSFVGKNGAGQTRFRLTDTGASHAFTGQLCKIVDEAQANYYIAILLSAQVSGTNVGVCLDEAQIVGVNNSVYVTCIYLQ